MLMLLKIKTMLLIVIARESCANTVIVIQHGSHSIKSEPIKMVFILPPTQIREQEAKNLRD